MFNLQVTLSDFRCRKVQFQLTDEFVIVFRFGSIKLDIKICPTYGQFIGGKRIVLDISCEQLEQMFAMYSVGMFIETKSLRLFSLLSLENLHYSDIISGQEVYFYNDSQQIVYSACFSIVFNDFKNPKMPNKQVIQNHKTFNQMFKKPAVPAAGKTMSSFLYGNNVKKNQQKAKPARPVSSKGQKCMSTKSQSNNKMMGKTTNHLKRQQPSQSSTTGITNNYPHKYEQTSISQQNIHIYNPFDDQPTQQHNPPMMQFTNTQTDPLSDKGMGLLKAQLQQINSVQGMKLMTVYESRNNGFMKKYKVNGEKDMERARIKIQQKLMMRTGGGGYVNNGGGDNNNNQCRQNVAATTTTAPISAALMLVNRQQLRTRAKQQLSTYQAATTIKIPILKDGKHQLIQLSQLTQQQIKAFAQKQKQLQFQQQMRKQMQRQLQKKEKENLRLKKELEDREREMKRKEQQAKKDREEMLKRHQQQMRINQQQQQQQQHHHIQQKQLSSQSQHQQQHHSNQSDQEQNDYEDSQIYTSQKQNIQSPTYHKQQSQEEQNYQSDFQSMTSANKLERDSLKSSQKKQQSSYNQQYDQDFQSYSHSFLDSRLRLSASGVSQTSQYSDHKK